MYFSHWTRWKYSSYLTIHSLDQMAAISQTICPDAFFINENVYVFIKNSLKFVPKSSIDNNLALVLIMA